ncbi:STM2901 family protein [Enterobacter cloacae]|uniref:STM2901 family protein n=1 Tax=Enterobacter cloacae TaxID=550 RepID=UPI0032AFBA2C
MDTVEALNGTYFYKGICNISAGVLFFWILLDKIEEQFGGIEDALTMSCIVLGLPLLKTRNKPYGTTAGTSIASKYLRQYLNVELPVRLPTLTEASIATLKPKYVTNLGAFVGRGLPVIGWTLVASDLAQICYKTLKMYNTIAYKKDRIW